MLQRVKILHINSNSFHLFLFVFISVGHDKDSLVGNQTSFPTSLVPGTFSSPGKDDLGVANGQNQQTNIDVTVQSPQQQQQPLLSPKSRNPVATSNQPPEHNASSDTTASSHQQGSFNDLPNLAASQLSEVRSGSTHSTQQEPQQSISTSVLPGTYVYPLTIFCMCHIKFFIRGSVFA